MSKCRGKSNEAKMWSPHKEGKNMTRPVISETISRQHSPLGIGIGIGIFYFSNQSTYLTMKIY